MALLTLDSISKYYGNGENKFHVLKDISFSIDSGEFIAVVGPSGSGKSTLMNIIGLLDQASVGSYEFDNKNVEKLSPNEQADLRKSKIGFVFQSFNLLNRHTVLDNITLPMIYNGVNKFDREKHGHDLLEKVGLTSRGLFRPNQLSGGQQQRVAIARALSNSPSLMLADEPTGNLDSKNGKKIMELIHDLNKQGNTIIIVTHDPKIAAQANRTIELVDGAIVSDKPAKRPKKKTAKKSAKAKKVNKK